MAKEHDFIFKIVLVGDSGVGKTSISLRYAENSFTPNVISAIGIDYRVRTIEFRGKKIKLQIWNTAGLVMIKLFGNLII